MRASPVKRLWHTRIGTCPARMKVTLSLSRLLPFDLSRELGRELFQNLFHGKSGAFHLSQKFVSAHTTLTLFGDDVVKHDLVAFQPVRSGDVVLDLLGLLPGLEHLGKNLRIFLEGQGWIIGGVQVIHRAVSWV